MTWQQANIQAAVTYLREQITRGSADPRTKAVYEGLLDVLDPTRRAGRLEREASAAVQPAVADEGEKDRRASVDRRSRRDRRLVNLGPPQKIERRRTLERRSSRDRRR